MANLFGGLIGDELIIHAPEAKDFNDQSKCGEKFTE
jgi:hypothetical protein